MQTMNALAEFMQNNFPGLLLRAPLFYSWPIGIRFDLQNESSSSDDAYFREVVRRAGVLFQAVFQADDPVLVVHQQWRGKRFRIKHSSYLLRQLNLPKALLSFQQIANPYPHSFQPGRWNRVCAITTASRIPYPAILAAISHQCFPFRKPALHNDTFFLNQRTGIIFHMYDDRGVDIIAHSASSLRHLYKTHNDLVLDYDRAKIAAVFV